MFPLRDLNPARTRPVITVAIVLLNVAVFFAWQPSMESEEAISFLYERAAVPCEVMNLQPITFEELTSGLCFADTVGQAAFPDKSIPLSVAVSLFLHGGLFHLFGNMWFLWLFGNNVEEAYGHVRYLVIYLIAGVAATAMFVLANPNSITPLVGASGSIAGVLGSYFILYPKHLVISFVFITVLPVPAVIFLGLWFLGQFLVTQPGVAWEAHAAGFVVGMAVTAMFRSTLLNRVNRIHRLR
jgi:membrane associated rhomboid family serine protease